MPLNGYERVRLGRPYIVRISADEMHYAYLHRERTGEPMRRGFGGSFVNREPGGRYGGGRHSVSAGPDEGPGIPRDYAANGTEVPQTVGEGLPGHREPQPSTT